MKLDTSKLLGFRLSTAAAKGAKIGNVKPGQAMGAKIGSVKPPLV